MQLGAAFARRADQHDREARVERHRRRAPPCRSATRPRCRRAWRRPPVGLEIVQPARRAPGPRAQRAPVVRLARLALVDQPDDALRRGRRRCRPERSSGLSDAKPQPAAISCSVRRRITARGRPPAARRRDALAAGPPSACRQHAAAEHDHDRHRALGVRRRDERHLDVDARSRDTQSCRRARQLLADHARCGPMMPRVVLVTVHVTAGRSRGTRPSTSRSKSSTISGRRCGPPHLGAW